MWRVIGMFFVVGVCGVVMGEGVDAQRKEAALRYVELARKEKGRGMLVDIALANLV